MADILERRGERFAAARAEGALDSPEAPRRVLERIVLRRGSLRGLGQRCGRSNMWLWRQVRQNKGLDLRKTGQVLAQLDVPLRFFYEEILDETSPYDPVWLLGHFREGSGPPRDLFLDRIERCFEAWLTQEPAPSSGKRRRTEIEALEERGYFDRQGAKRDLELLAGQMLEVAQLSPGPSHGEIADGALLLLVWAGLQRAGGCRDDASDAYMLAYRLATASRDSRVLGSFFYSVAELLAEQGQTSHALRFAERACTLFQHLRDRDLLAQGLLQSATLLYHLGRGAEARLEGIAALRLAPRRSRRTRARGWILLANLALERGAACKALARVRRAEVFCPEAGFLRATVLWRQGVIIGHLAGHLAGHLGSLAAAQPLLRQAMELFELFGQARDVALVAIDLVELLIRGQKLEPALAMAKDLTPCFERLRSPLPAMAMWMDLLALVMQGAQDGALEQAFRLRAALQQGDAKIRLPADL